MLLTIIITAYITGLIVCFIYDLTLNLCGMNPQGSFKFIGKIFDYIIWPLTLIGAFLIALLFGKRIKRG